MGFSALLRFLALLLRLLLREFRIGIHFAEPFCEIVDLIIVVLNVGDDVAPELPGSQLLYSCLYPGFPVALLVRVAHPLGERVAYIILQRLSHQVYLPREPCRSEG